MLNNIPVPRLRISAPRVLRSALLVAFLALWSSPVLPCACCAEPGERTLYTITVDDWIHQDLERLRPAATAHLFLTACGMECVSGIENPQPTYSVDPFGTQMPWQIAFADETGAQGTISLKTPLEIQQFLVDIAPQPETPSPQLFKEWRLKVLATGTGIFADGLGTDTPADFILQGEGNNCSQAGDFTHWRLEVKSPTAEFTLFGKLDAPQ